MVNSPDTGQVNTVTPHPHTHHLLVALGDQILALHDAFLFASNSDFILHDAEWWHIDPHSMLRHQSLNALVVGATDEWVVLLRDLQLLICLLALCKGQERGLMVEKSGLLHVYSFLVCLFPVSGAGWSSEVDHSEIWYISSSLHDFALCKAQGEAFRGGTQWHFVCLCIQ